MREYALGDFKGGLKSFKKKGVGTAAVFEVPRGNQRADVYRGGTPDVRLSLLSP